MKSFVQFRALLALAVIAITASATPAFAEIVYNVTNYESGQNGWTLAGTITVSGVGTSFNSSVITAWNLTATKEGSTSLLLANDVGFQPGAALLSGTLNATPSQLLLSTNGNFGFSSQDSETSDYNGLYWINEYFGFGLPVSEYSGSKLGGNLWNGSAFSPVDGREWVLGTASAVPEIDPATGGSALSLVAGVLAMIEQRRRRATLVARSTGL